MGIYNIWRPITDSELQNYNISTTKLQHFDYNNAKQTTTFHPKTTKITTTNYNFLKKSYNFLLQNYNFFFYKTTTKKFKNYKFSNKNYKIRLKCKRFNGSII